MGETLNLNDVYLFWFNPLNSKLHFNSTEEDDIMIRDTFKTLHDYYTLNSYEDTTNIKEGIGYIILLDQITRHIYRNDKETIDKNLNKIVPYCNEFYKVNYNILNIDEFSFTLLPLRHTKDFTNISFVIQESWKMINRGHDMNRFLTATYQQYIKQCDDRINLKFHKFIKTSDRHISDRLHTIFADTSVLGEIEDNPLYELFNSEYLDKSKEYIISLSGGVDSMVTSYIMKKNGYNIKAVHISYMNRPECNLEIEFLKEWVNILEIDLYYREINEIHRKPCMDCGLRLIYESYTKEIRFKTYKNTSVEPNVLLGHNNDDCFENILTNISSKSHLENLTGMTRTTIIDGINFIRPMLDIPKKDISKFAQDHKIPYLPTSTPARSQRGKIRDIVKPKLQEWNPNMVDSMFVLSKKLTSLTQLVDLLVDKTCKEIKRDGYIKIDIENLINQEYYWEKIFEKLDIKISSKSLKNFIEKLEFIKNKLSEYKINEKFKHNMNITTQFIFKKISSTELIITY